jgi:hypothetical protein
MIEVEKLQLFSLGLMGIWDWILGYWYIKILFRLKRMECCGDDGANNRKIVSVAERVLIKLSTIHVWIFH